MAEYIERGAAYRAIEIACNGCPCEKTVAGSVCHDCSIMKAKSELQVLPAADVRPVVRGRWELAKDGWYCTACELYPPFDCDPEEKGIPYCPNCGSYNGGDISVDE